MNRFLVIICMLCLEIPICGSVRKSMVVFPLRNESKSTSHAWIGSSIPEFFSRRTSQIESIQLWDPAFLFRTDSTSWSMRSDSLLKIHQARWQWDAAIGGKYRVIDDLLQVNMRIFMVNDRYEPLKFDLALEGKLSEFEAFCSDLFFRISTLMGVSLSASDSSAVSAKMKIGQAAYRTFAAGYGFEMRKQSSSAFTAYSRAAEMEPQFAAAFCRLGILCRTSGRPEQARTYFARAMSAGSKDPAIVAEMADFLIETETPDIAGKFIESNRQHLNKTSAGMEAMGKYYTAVGEYQRSISVLTRAVAAGASDLEARFALGIAYLSSADFRSAADIFNALLRFRPDYLRYYSTLGATYRRSGQLMESTMVLESALKMEPDNVTILVELAHTYFMLDWFDRAGQLLLRAHDLRPRLGDIQINLGVVYWHQGREQDAKKIFSEAARNSAVRQPAYNNLGNLLFLGGNTHKAISAYLKADKSGSSNPVILHNIAMAYYEKGRLSKAAHYFDEVLRLSPGRIDVILRQASLAEQLKRPAQAEGYYKKILEISPYHEDVIVKLVKLLASQNRHEEATRPIETYLSHLPNSREFMILLADLYRDMEWYEVAIMKYQFIIRDFPTDPAGYLGVGRCMFNMIAHKGARNFESTIHALMQAAQHAPGNPEPYILIGDIYMDYRGYRELAVENWDMALKTATDPATQKAVRKRLERAR